MTEMLWYKRFHGTAYDPKFTAAGIEAGSTHCNALAVWDALLETTSEHEEDRGSLANVDFRIVAAGLRLAHDEVQRIWNAFVSLGMIAGERVVKWAKRQRARVAETVSAAALRTRRWRQKKARDPRQGEMLFAMPGGAAGAEARRSPGASARPSPPPSHPVTTPVTVTGEEEGEARDSQSLLNTESLPVAAREVDFKKADGSLGRSAPPSPLDQAVKTSKRNAWLSKLHDWAGRHFTGEALMEAQSLLFRAQAAAASDSEWRARPPAERKWLDRLDNMMKGKEPKRPVVLMPSLAPEPQDEPLEESSAAIYQFDQFDRTDPPVLPGRQMVLDEIDQRYSPEQVAAFYEAWSRGGERARHAEELFEAIRKEIGAPCDDPLFGLERVA